MNQNSKQHLTKVASVPLHVFIHFHSFVSVKKKGNGTGGASLQFLGSTSTGTAHPFATGWSESCYHAARVVGPRTLRTRGQGHRTTVTEAPRCMMGASVTSWRRQEGRDPKKLQGDLLKVHVFGVS